MEKKKAKGLLDEFKAFISRGNVLDLAVGVIIGSAFGKIVTTLVESILMPVIGVITGGHDLSESLSITVGNAVVKFGIFIQAVIDFLIVAFCIFLFVKFINRFLDKIKKEEKEEKKEEVKKSDEVLLLEEIRDLLKKQNK